MSYALFLSLDEGPDYANGGGKTHYTILMPGQMIALVDPNANWLRSWLHGYLGRSVFFKLLTGPKDYSSSEQLTPINKYTFISSKYTRLCIAGVKNRTRCCYRYTAKTPKATQTRI